MKKLILTALLFAWPLSADAQFCWTCVNSSQTFRCNDGSNQFWWIVSCQQSDHMFTNCQAFYAPQYVCGGEYYVWIPWLCTNGTALCGGPQDLVPLKVRPARTTGAVGLLADVVERLRWTPDFRLRIGDTEAWAFGEQFWIRFDGRLLEIEDVRGVVARLTCGKDGVCR